MKILILVLFSISAFAKIKCPVMAREYSCDVEVIDGRDISEYTGNLEVFKHEFRDEDYTTLELKLDDSDGTVLGDFFSSLPSDFGTINEKRKVVDSIYSMGSTGDKSVQITKCRGSVITLRQRNYYGKDTGHWGTAETKAESLARRTRNFKTFFVGETKTVIKVLEAKKLEISQRNRGYNNLKLKCSPK